MNKIFLLILIFTSSITENILSQNLITQEWVRSFSLPTNNSQVASDIATDINGNIYVTGYNAAGYSESDFMTVKYSPGGEFLWGKSYYNPNVAYSHERAKSIAVYSNAGQSYIYVAGEVTYSGFTQYIALIKYDEFGNQKWGKGIFLAAFGANHILKKVFADESGNVYLTGGTSDKLFLSKYDSLGNLIVSATYPNPSGYTFGQGNDIKVNSSGDIYVSGQLLNGSGLKVPTLLKFDIHGTLIFYNLLAGFVNSFEIESELIIGQSGNIYSGQMMNNDYSIIKYNPAGDTIWTQRYNGTSNTSDYFNALVIDSNENSYLTGRVNGNFGDIGTVKYDSSGTFQWIRIYAGTGGWADEGRDIGLDSEGNIFVTGSVDISVGSKYVTLKYNSSGTLQWSGEYDFAPGDYEDAIALVMDDSGNVIATGNSSYITISDYATVKYNSSGERMWARKYNASQTSTDRINSIATDNYGNVYAIGRIRTGQSGDNIQLIKYNSAGVKKWEYNRGGISQDIEDAGNAVTVDDNGYVYYTGTMHTTISGNKIDVYTAKLDSNGNHVWAYPFGVLLGSTGNDEGVEIATDNSGNIYVGYNSEIVIGNIKYGIRKYNSSGLVHWGYGYSGSVSDTDKLRDMKVDKDGNVYLLGNSRGVSSGVDIVTIKISSSGVQQWVNVYNGSANGNDDARSIDVDNNGNVYVTGSALNTSTGNDIVVIKYNPGGAQEWAFTRSNGINLKESGAVVKYDSLSSLVKVAGNGEYNLLYNSLALYQLNLDSAGAVYSEIISNPSQNNNFVIGGSLDDAGIFLSASARESTNSGYDFRCWRGLNYFTDFNGTSSGNDIPAINESISSYGNYFYVGVTSFDSVYGNVITVIKYKSPVYQMNMNMFIQGFYNPYYGNMAFDTIRVTLRNSLSPYNIIDSARAYCTFEGQANEIPFLNISGSNQYYIAVNHRNSIETWSNTPITFGPGYLNVDFRDTANVFGNNLIRVPGTYSKFCVYNGDVNQDGIVDATDLGAIDNDAANFTTGYVNTDVTGDDVTDASDAALADNNAANFVTAVVP